MAILKGDNFEIRGVRLVVFDRDGTLIDLYNYWAGMIGLRSELISRELNLEDKDKKALMYAMGIDLDKKHLRPEGPVGLKKREIVMQAAVDYLGGISIKGSTKLCFEAFKKADELSLDKMDAFLKPLEGLTSLLGSLKKNGCMIAIATTDKSHRAKMTMERLGIIDYFSVILGADSVKRPKPAPEMLNLILNRLNINKEEAVMVGDAVTDIQMGISAGVKTIGVTSGLATEEKLRQLTPCVISDISHLEVLNGD